MPVKTLNRSKPQSSAVVLYFVAVSFIFYVLMVQVVAVKYANRPNCFMRDYVGKKISDKFEKKRAHSLLNAMLNQHPGMECEANLLRYKNYHFTTQAQFNLLMETAGYKIKSDEQHHQYYKHGNLQGKINKAELNKLKAPI